jgi:hypothetical protein
MTRGVTEGLDHRKSSQVLGRYSARRVRLLDVETRPVEAPRLDARGVVLRVLR